MFIFLSWDQINDKNKMLIMMCHNSILPIFCSGVTEYECDNTMGGKRLVQTCGDVLLGTCIIPLAQLLARHAGKEPLPAVGVPVLWWW